MSVKDVNEHSIIVQLLEYNKMEGLITQAEYSKTNKSKYNQGILKVKKMKKQEVCKVIRVDKEKFFIDLSKKQIRMEDIREVEERYEKSKKIHSFLFPLCDVFKKDIEFFYEKVIWPLYKEKPTEHPYDVLLRSVFNFDEELGFLKLEKDFRDLLESELKKRLTPLKLKVKAIFSLKCFSFNGIEDIKASLLAAAELSTKDNPLDIKLIFPPNYIIQTESFNQKTSIEIVEKGLALIEKEILSRSGKYELLEFIKPQQNDKNEILKFLERNKFKDGEDDENDSDEAEDIEGMGNIDFDEKNFSNTIKEG